MIQLSAVGYQPLVVGDWPLVIGYRLVARCSLPVSYLLAACCTLPADGCCLSQLDGEVDPQLFGVVTSDTSLNCDVAVETSNNIARPQTLSFLLTADGCYVMADSPVVIDDAMQTPHRWFLCPG